MTERRLARFRVRPELLKEILMLPADCEIRGVKTDVIYGLDFEFLVESEAFDAVPEGSPVPLRKPTYRSESTPKFDGWSD